MDASVKLTVYFSCLGLLFALNLASFLAMLVDKRRAQARGSARRIPEKTLFWLAGLFGGFGGVLGMYALRHKTQHTPFRVLFPLMATAQLALLIWGTAALIAA